MVITRKHRQQVKKNVVDFVKFRVLHTDDSPHRIALGLEAVSQLPLAILMRLGRFGFGVILCVDQLFAGCEPFFL